VVECGRRQESIVFYAGAAAAAAAAAVLVDRSPKDTLDQHDLDEYEVAYLTGGARLAAVVALVNLDRRGAIDLGDGLLRDLRDSGDLDLDAVRDADHLAELGVELHVRLAKDDVATAAVAHPVEAAALQAARGTKPRTPWRVIEAVTGTRAVGAVRDGLERRGLLHAPADVDRIQARWRWLLPVLAVGGAHAWADTTSGRLVWALVAVMLLTVMAMKWLARRQPVNTRHGERRVAELRSGGPERVEAPVAGRASGLALALAGTGWRPSRCGGTTWDSSRWSPSRFPPAGPFRRR